MIINWGDVPFKAFITVTYPSGTCTVTGEGQTYSHSGGGTTTFTVKKKGTYTVSAANSGASASQSVSIANPGEIQTVVLSYVLYIFKAGTGINSAVGISPVTHFGYNSNYVLTNDYFAGLNSNNGNIYATSNTINITPYKTMYVDMACTARHSSPYTGTIGVGTDKPTGDNKPGSFLVSKGGIYTGRTTHSVDVSGVNQAAYAKIAMYAISHYVYNWWFTS